MHSRLSELGSRHRQIVVADGVQHLLVQPWM
jgi:hypothetical protein